MLVLSRKANESIQIGDDIEVTVLEIRGDQVRLGITAPKPVPIKRDDCKQTTPLQVCSQCHGAGGFPIAAPHLQKCLHCGGEGVRR